MYSKINFNESKCGLYTLDYIYQSAPLFKKYFECVLKCTKFTVIVKATAVTTYPNHPPCSKVNLECVLKCTKFTVKQANSYMFETNLSSIEHQYKQFGDSFNKEGRKNKNACPTV